MPPYVAAQGSAAGGSSSRRPDQPERRSCICGAPSACCTSCINKGLAQQRSIKVSLESQLRQIKDRCEAHAARLSGWRELRAEVAQLERRNGATRARLSRVNDDIAAHSPRSIRRAAPAPKHVDAASAIQTELAKVRRAQRAIDARIVAARQVLVGEAAAVMGLKRWEIAGLSLPPMKEIRLHPPAFINAALLHTLHLLDLYTRYLSVSLPFEPDPGTLRTRRPALFPNVPFVSTTKYREKAGQPLYRSGSSSSSSSSALSSVSASTAAPGSRSYRAFLTSYALLSHAVAYLAWTQGVDERTIAANLVALAESPQLGLKSHLGPKRMRNMAFSLDVHEVVAEVLAEGGVGQRDEWEMV